MTRRVIPLLLAVLLVISMGLTAYAHDVPDMERTGSISITMCYGVTPVGGGTLTLYRVGEVQENNGDYSFAPTGDFVDCGEVFDAVDEPELAQRLAEYAHEKALKGKTQSIRKDGTVCFEQLTLGLYLLVQETPAKGFSPAAPFVVSLPMLEEGKYVYEVDATTKTELIHAPTTPTPTPPIPDDPKLPQTGQLNWPVPLMAVGGLGLFILGWILCFGRKKDENET